MATTQQQLDEINSAISAILTGAQEYQVGQRRVRKADLNFLLAERTRLERKLFIEDNDGGIAYYGSTT